MNLLTNDPTYSHSSMNSALWVQTIDNSRRIATRAFKTIRLRHIYNISNSFKNIIIQHDNHNNTLTKKYNSNSDTHNTSATSHSISPIFHIKFSRNIWSKISDTDRRNHSINDILFQNTSTNTRVILDLDGTVCDITGTINYFRQFQTKTHTHLSERKSDKNNVLCQYYLFLTPSRFVMGNLVKWSSKIM